MRNLVVLFLSILSFSTSAQLKSPAEFLGYELGERFSRHSDVVRYYEHVAANSDQVLFQEYGKTYEGRSLILLTVGSVENIKQIETIREDNLRRTGMKEGTPSTEVSIVWLSYNVHGNEANSTEASMATIYELLNKEASKEWFKNTVVIIDPCLNPDGRDRYVNFYNQYGNQFYNPDPQTIEHVEPWPRGRRNHYLYDLNRDWAWQTQIESQQRLKVYNQWMPQVHVDFHEQYYNSPYYFAPAAEPLHEQITDWQREFQIVVGKNNAKYFDQNNWLYFTKQSFDLLYPSYGDSYPMFNGSIGMTYEQAGHGMGGLGVIKQDGDTLTLLDRLTHHKTTGLSTIEISSKNGGKLLYEFEKFFDSPVKGKYQSFVLKYDGKDKFDQLKKWLDSNGIEYGRASKQKGLEGFNYATSKERSFSISDDDLVVTTDQPKGLLAKVLFEPETKIVDSVTYDITAWSVPYFFGLDAYATSATLNVRDVKSEESTVKETNIESTYAVIYKWNNLKDARFLAKLLQEGVKIRFTKKAINISGELFNPGSLIITKTDNNHLSSFESYLKTMEAPYDRKGHFVQTGFMDRGPDLGSGDISFLKAPKVALLAGEGTSLDGVGPTWYFMEQELGYPVSMLWVSRLIRSDLSKYDVIIMQDGSYSNVDKKGLEKMTDWVSEGGKLIVFKSAIWKFADTDFAKISAYNSEEEKQMVEMERKSRKEMAKLVRYEDRERDNAKNIIPGAIFKVNLDNSHPMAFGYGESYYSLKTSKDRFGYLDSHNVGVIESRESHISGFAGQYVLEDVGQSLVFGVENKGRGQFVYFVDNVLFRSFWQEGKLMVANAIFFVGK